MGTDATDTRRWSLAAAGFGADVYLFTLLSLAVWVLLPTLLLGWSPILVSSGSMSPAIETGDLVLIDEDVPGDPIAPGAIITYREPGRDPDRLVTHRIRETTSTGVYTTRGDANVVDDARPVPHDRVVGYARLLVPLLGLPIHWARTGAQFPLLAFAGLTVLALACSAAAARQDRRTEPLLDAAEPEQTPRAAPQATVAATSGSVDRSLGAAGDRPAPVTERPAAAAGRLSPRTAAEEPLFAPDRSSALAQRSTAVDPDTIDELFAPALPGGRAPDGQEPSGRPGRSASPEPSLWGTTRPARAVTPPTRTPPPAARGGRAVAQRPPLHRREQRARAARRRALQPVLFLLVSVALLVSGISLPVTEAGFTAGASNTGNVFATAPAGPQPEPLPPELELPPVDGQPSFPAGQQPETITFDVPVEGVTTLEGAAAAVLRVRPSTRGNAPRSVGVTLLHDGGEVLAATFLEQQGWADGWTQLTLTLEPDLEVTLQRGDMLTVEIEIRRLELDLDGGSVVSFPVVAG